MFSKPSTSDFESTLAIDTIVVPQGAEYQAVCRGLAKFNLAQLRLIKIPMGRKNMSQILTRYAPFDEARKVLLLGLCGSLSQGYPVGDGVVVTSCQNLDRQQINLDVELTNKIKHKLSLKAVTGLTSDRIITQAVEKQRLGQHYCASVVEMEGYGWATWLQQRGIAVAMVRVVSDDLKGDLPDLSRAVDHKGNLQPLPMTAAFLRQPQAAIRLIRGSLIGLNALSKITAKLFTESN